MKHPFENKLIETLRLSPLFKSIFEKSHEIHLKNWYIAGGCVTQTIWNATLNLNPLHGLKDVDLIYFDPHENKSEELENKQKVQKIFNDLPLPIDTINEAKVHNWYASQFGYQINPYKDCIDAISTWLPAFSIGVRVETSKVHIIAPFGLEDTFNMVVRPNKRQITESIYTKMTSRLVKDWPSIQVEPW